MLEAREVAGKIQREASAAQAAFAAELEQHREDCRRLEMENARLKVALGLPFTFAGLAARGFIESSSNAARRAS